MNMRRRFTYAFVVLVAMGAVVVPYLLIPTAGFTESQFRRLRQGMTKEDVVRTLGAPPGDYTGGKGEYRVTAGLGGAIVDAAYIPERLDDCWCGHHGRIDVVFDEKGRLASADFLISWPPPPNLWERIKGWVSIRK